MKNVYAFLFVFVPMLALLLGGIFLDTERTTSAQERRLLTEIPDDIFRDRGQLEKYISDHLSLRDQMLSLYFTLNLGFDFGTETVILGRNDFLYQKTKPVDYNLPVIVAYQNKTLFSDAEFQKIADNLLQIKRLCDENNIKFYLMFPPGKERIYSRYMPSYIIRENRPSPVKQLASKLSPEITVIPLEDFLIKNARKSRDLLYYKQDTHWSEDGAFLAYLQLMQAIQNDFPFAKPQLKSRFKIKKRYDVFAPYQNLRKEGLYTKGNLLLPGQKYHTMYNHYMFRDSQNVSLNTDAQFISSSYPAGLPLNVLIVGDSYATYLYPFLSATFQNVSAYRFNNPYTHEQWGIHFYNRLEEMLANKSNIFILSISDLKLKDLLDPFK